eukprot:TRINITY_DN3302_c0_g1_i1.p1 TRINITY_DN3302_c0_g1~~TRINITY_DN3302_c0_g1_i1.p1  ORF type:complete len:301 (-),score=74.99 TRINITY_DN3302_c0_g1_i1:38-907(-)
MDDQGRTYHLETAEGQVANRIILCHTGGFALEIAKKMTSVHFKHVSGRDYVTYTGLYKDVPLTVCALNGLGPSMIDFAIREMKAILPPCPTAMVLLSEMATTPKKYYQYSTLVAKDSVAVVRNPNADQSSTNPLEHYTLQTAAPADTELVEILTGKLTDAKVSVKSGTNCSSSSYLFSRAIDDTNFEEGSQGLLDAVVNSNEQIACLDMETFHLFDLARISSDKEAPICPAMVAVLTRAKDETIKMSEISQRALARSVITPVLNSMVAWTPKKDIAPQNPVWEGPAISL